MIKFTEDNRIVNTESYRAITVGLQLSRDIRHSMDELSGLAEAAGAEVIAEAVQSLPRPNTATWIGSGKVQELAELVSNMDADLVIFNDELTGMQIRNLEDALGVRVIDRTILILDIFAARAESAEGKLQVELAQLAYRMPRLTGFGRSLSRLGGGIGTRGPGEKKLETDRRHIEKRMDDIRRELRRTQNTRKVQRSQREHSDIHVVALVGYTNRGKSAIMNRLLAMTEKEDKSVQEKDMLFATLDPQRRGICLDPAHQFVLIDTVGFVSGLPHGLVEAFKSTLEEVRDADLLLHVVDASYEENQFQIQVTEKVLGEIGAGHKDRIMVFNKTDLTNKIQIPAKGEDNVFVSAKTGQNMDQMLKMIQDHIFGDIVRTTLLIPYSRGDLNSYLCSRTKVYSVDYRENGMLVDTELTRADYQRLKDYEVIQHSQK